MESVWSFREVTKSPYPSQAVFSDKAVLFDSANVRTSSRPAATSTASKGGHVTGSNHKMNLAIW